MRDAVRLLHPGNDHVRQTLLDQNPDPTREEIKKGVAGNFCRCTGYTKIFESIEAAARAMKGGRILNGEYSVIGKRSRA